MQDDTRKKKYMPCCKCGGVGKELLSLQSIKGNQLSVEWICFACLFTLLKQASQKEKTR